VAGTAAAFEREKGHGVLLDAAAILRSRGVRMRYVLAGGGRLEDSIAAGAAERGLDLEIRRIGGSLTFERYLEMLDIYVLPSLEEGLSTGLIAAMASGLPCVASRTGGIPEVTGEDAAMLFDPGDPAGLAAALEMLAGDPAAREAYSSRGSERARLFDVEKMVDGTIEVYEKVLERGTG
jgi:glycosyltransferase involved in cell wall biosynthesis